MLTSFLKEPGIKHVTLFWLGQYHFLKVISVLLKKKIVFYLARSWLFPCGLFFPNIIVNFTYIIY